MRVLLIIALVGCHHARPVEPPRVATPPPTSASTSPSGKQLLIDPTKPDQGITLDTKYLNNIPLPPEFYFPAPEAEDNEREPAGFFPTIPGRYYVDGIYIQSRGPSYTLWR